MHSCYWFVHVQVESSSTLCILFSEKKSLIVRTAVCSSINTEANIYRADGFNGSGRELSH